MLKTDSIDTSTLKLLYKLQNTDFLDDFILVGGTALSLIVGHRLSIDLDLFSTNTFNSTSLLEHLEDAFSFQMDKIEENTIIGSIGGVKVDIIAHRYPYIKEPLFINGLRIASLEDIAAMKINAIANNGTRVKDFIDLHKLLKTFTLEEMLSYFKSKYALRNTLYALKSINYFDEVRLDDYPKMLGKNANWKTIKKELDIECNMLLSKFKRDDLTNKGFTS